MSVTLRQGQSYSFRAFLECQSFSVLQSAGVTTAGLKAAFQNALSTRFHVTDLRVESYNSFVAADSLSISVVGTPATDLETGDASEDSIETAIALVSQWGALIHPQAYNTTVSPANSVGMAILTAANLEYARVAGSHYDSGKRFYAYRTATGSYYVVQESSVRQSTTLPAPAGAPTTAGQVSRALNSVASTDPQRDGNTAAGNSVRESVEGSTGFSLPPWVMVGGAVLVGLVALIAVGYAARGVAQVAREV